MPTRTTLPYQDSSLPTSARVDDLLSRMTLQQKAGQMFHAILGPGPLDVKFPPFKEVSGQEMLNKGITHFNLLGSLDSVQGYVDFFNKVQASVRASDPLGIPVTFSTDPRHSFNENLATSMTARLVSKWPEHIGMAALGDENRMEEYANIVRQEYVALGFRAALHPQADLSTEYRWSRISGGLGEDSELASKLCAAHVRGLQVRPALGPDSVAACVKHFPGGAPTREGLDPHFSWGSDQVYPGNNLNYHVEPFRRAIGEQTRFVMPSYAKPIGLPGVEEVSMAFNKKIITGMLKGDLGFDGVVLSDWGILTDSDEELMGDFAKRRAWGLEKLTREELVVKALDAGVDQIGGEYCVDVMVNVVKQGLVPESRIDMSVRKLLAVKFDLGLFDTPFVDLAKAQAVVGRKDFIEAGLKAQKDALVMLDNKKLGNGRPLLPLVSGIKVYVEGFRQPELESYGTLAQSPASADVAVIKLATNFDASIGKGWFAARFHHGTLEFSEETLQHIEEVSRDCPVIVVIAAERPPVLGTLVDSASALFCSFGIEEKALIEVLFGEGGPGGKLPFDLPRSDLAVAQSRSDVAYDTKDPTFRFGHGLRY